MTLWIIATRVYMTASEGRPADIRVELLHEPHPRIRAEDWRSPLIARLLDNTDYADGRKTVDVSYRDQAGSVKETTESLTWTAMKEDYDKCVNTYQAPVLTEFAALGIACILCARRQLEITEVTRRGEKVDYWIGNRESLLEVSGTTSEELEVLCERKATQQLMPNPMGKGGFVCAAAFHKGSARLWYYQR
jgi:hypothetical protein